jgi:hypothetical protein
MSKIEKIISKIAAEKGITIEEAWRILAKA